jgi:hypothetical protein
MTNLDEFGRLYDIYVNLVDYMNWNWNWNWIALELELENKKKKLNRSICRGGCRRHRPLHRPFGQVYAEGVALGVEGELGRRATCPMHARAYAEGVALGVHAQVAPPACATSPRWSPETCCTPRGLPSA